MKDAIEKTLNDYEELEISDDYVDEKDNLALEKYMSENRDMLLSRKKTQKDDDLYLILDKEANLLKIGRSTNVESRLKQIQSANGHVLELLCIVKNKGNLESTLHDKFSKLKTSGEWYKYSDDIINEYSSLGGVFLNKIINKDKKEEKELKEKEVVDFVERIYKMYPTRCPKRNVSLGKSAKDKERIKRLLKIYKQEDIENVVKREVEEKYGKTYMQNFSTFLNNFPDPNSLFSEEKLENSSVQDDVLLKRFYDILSVNEEAHIYGINEYEFSILNEQQRNYIRNQYRSKMLEWIKSQNR